VSFSPLINQTIEALQCLPGVGPKSAQRMAMHLLERDRDACIALGNVLLKASSEVGRCESCRILTEKAQCDICASARRDRSLLCIVETPADVLALEQAGTYRGLYFVLLGHLSPIDGIGPAEIGVDLLLQRADDEGFNEVILATNPTVEGEATAYYISEQLRKRGVTVSRIAHGVPLGGELEYVDGGTLAHALNGRQVL
jgi:recombination protein RecR